MHNNITIYIKNLLIFQIYILLYIYFQIYIIYIKNLLIFQIYILLYIYFQI